MARAAVSSAAGSSGELDTAGLLHVAARLDGPVTAVIVSSGLQSAGPLAVGEIGWDRIGSAAVVEEAARRELVPDLSDTVVIFSGLGDTAGPQGTLPAPLRARLVGFWLALCDRGGAVRCELDGAAAPGAAPNSAVPVRPVAVPAEAPLFLPAPVGPAAERIELGTDLAFAPDDATLLPAARAVLADYAARLRSADVVIALVGHTASVPPSAGARALSVRRATAVRDVLVAGGVPADRVTATGVGYDDPLVADRDASGALIPEAAQRNRTVVLTVTPIGGPE